MIWEWVTVVDPRANEAMDEDSSGMWSEEGAEAMDATEVKISWSSDISDVRVKG